MATSAAAAGVGEEADTIGVFFSSPNNKKALPNKEKKNLKSPLIT
jgi:trans-2-enoyl-CoA reductase